MSRWRNLIPGWVWRMSETSAGVYPNARGQAKVPDDEVGEVGPCDWRGTPILPGSTIVYPSEAYGSSVQMTLAEVIELRTDGMTARVIRRSRTGLPNGEYDRKTVRLTAVGIANSTVVPVAA